MKDMLANLPQYQEMREKVWLVSELVQNGLIDVGNTVLTSLEHGGAVYEYF